VRAPDFLAGVRQPHGQRHAHLSAADVDPHDSCETSRPDTAVFTRRSYRATDRSQPAVAIVLLPPTSGSDERLAVARSKFTLGRQPPAHPGGDSNLRDGEGGAGRGNVGAARLSHRMRAALRWAAALTIAGSTACAGGHPRTLLEAHPELSGIASEVRARLDFIWRFEREASCRQPVREPKKPWGYTMEPPPVSEPSILPTPCDHMVAVARRLWLDLIRIYGGCEACISDCSAGNRLRAHDCWFTCDLWSLDDYERHVKAFTAVFSVHGEAWPDWRRLVAPLPDPPVKRGEELRCLDPAPRKFGPGLQPGDVCRVQDRLHVGGMALDKFSGACDTRLRCRRSTPSRCLERTLTPPSLACLSDVAPAR